MLSLRILQSIRYWHISVIRKYKLGEPGTARYKEADKWVSEHNFEKVKTYKDFCTKHQEVHNVQITLSEEEEKYVQQTYLYERPGVAWTKQLPMPAYRLNDHELEFPIQGKTLISFIKEGIIQRKPHQLLLFYFTASIIIHTVLYFGFWYKSEDDTYVANVTLNPQYLETYTIQHCAPPLREYKRKMGVYLQDILQISDVSQTKILK